MRGYRAIGEIDEAISVGDGDGVIAEAVARVRIVDVEKGLCFKRRRHPEHIRNLWAIAVWLRL